MIEADCGAVLRCCAPMPGEARAEDRHVADLQVPVSCAGVAANAGDLIHGDADNVSVVPAHLAEAMAGLCEAQDGLEAYLAMRVQAGE